MSAILELSDDDDGQEVTRNSVICASSFDTAKGGGARTTPSSERPLTNPDYRPSHRRPQAIILPKSNLREDEAHSRPDMMDGNRLRAEIADIHYQLTKNDEAKIGHWKLVGSDAMCTESEVGPRGLTFREREGIVG